jgi:hypothetical protein
MKKLLFFVVFILTIASVSGQKSIDAIFDKYAGKDGFVTVTLSGNLLKFAACLGDDDDDNALPDKITEIRVLAQEDKHMNVENFYDLAIKDLNLNSYDEFMRIKESDQDIRMLVRSEGNRFKEFLLIVGGDDNALIQIKGDMTYAEARKFSADAKKNHGMHLVVNHE